MKKRVRWKVLVASLIIVYLVAFIGSIFTGKNTNTAWYQEIKPEITPPNYVFPIVWNILFFLIALSLYFAWISSDKREKKIVTIVFSINLFLNILWSFLFFYFQNPTAAFYEIIVFWFSILVMIFVAGKVSKISSYLLIPYLLWVSFAVYLNYLMVFS